jgi:hypothetical protein
MFNWFRKHYLVSYEVQKFQSLNSNGIDFNMNIETVYPFGIIRHSVEVIHVGLLNDIDKTIEKWDAIIKSRKPIN